MILKLAVLSERKGIPDCFTQEILLLFILTIICGVFCLNHIMKMKMGMFCLIIKTLFFILKLEFK